MDFFTVHHVTQAYNSSSSDCMKDCMAIYCVLTELDIAVVRTHFIEATVTTLDQLLHCKQTHTTVRRCIAIDKLFRYLCTTIVSVVSYSRRSAAGGLHRDAGYLPSPFVGSA